MCIHALRTSQGLLIHSLVSADIMISFASTNHGKKENIWLERDIPVFVRIQGLNCRQHVKDNIVFPKCTLICVPSSTVCITALHHWRVQWLVVSCRVYRKCMQHFAVNLLLFYLSSQLQHYSGFSCCKCKSGSSRVSPFMGVTGHSDSPVSCGLTDFGHAVAPA